MYFFERWVLKKVEEQGRVSIPVPHACSACALPFELHPLYPVHIEMHKTHVQIPYGKFFCKFTWVSSAEQNHEIFSENEFLPAKLRDTNIQATVCGTMMVSVVSGNSWGGNRGNRLCGPYNPLLNKLRDKNRTDIDCVVFCAWKSAVSRYYSFLFTTVLAGAGGRLIPPLPCLRNNTKNLRIDVKIVPERFPMFWRLI